MSIGELTQESMCRLVDLNEPLIALRETIGEWQLGGFSISRREPTFRVGYGGHLSESSRFKKQNFGPTKHARSGVALIFRQFDRSPHQDSPAEYFVGWVPADREQELDGWLTFMNNEVRKRRAGEASDQTRATYSYGNPHAPFGMGNFIVELCLDSTVRLVHTKQGTSRTWIGRALPALWTELNVALATSKFPTRPSVRSAPAGEDSFKLSVTRDAKEVTVSGFVSPEYKDVTLLFGDIVTQMSKAEVLGFEPPTATPYVTEVHGP